MEHIEWAEWADAVVLLLRCIAILAHIYFDVVLAIDTQLIPPFCNLHVRDNDDFRI